MINMGLAEYHDEHGCFPPAYVAGHDGTPMHSWRILICKYVAPTTYEAYDFSEPWNSPRNRQLMEESWVAPYFKCPDGSPEESLFTDYVVVVGPQTAFPGTASTTCLPLAPYYGARGYRDMIIVVEIAGSNILWTEPRDLEFDTMSFQINDPNKPSISSNHRGGANVAMRHSAGGVFVPESTSPMLIKSLLTMPGADADPDASLWLPRD